MIYQILTIKPIHRKVFKLKIYDMLIFHHSFQASIFSILFHIYRLIFDFYIFSIDGVQRLKSKKSSINLKMFSIPRLENNGY